MPKGKVAAGVVLLLVGATLMIGAFFSPAKLADLFEDDNSRVVLTASDLFQVGTFVNIVAFALMAFGMPKAATLTTHWLNSIGVVSICFGLLGFGVCAMYHSLDPLLLALGAAGVSASFVSLHVRDRPYRPDNRKHRKPSVLSETEFAEALVRMRGKNFSVAYDPSGPGMCAYDVAQLLYSELKKAAIPADRVWGDGSVHRGTEPGSEIDTHVYIASPTRPGFDVAVTIWCHAAKSHRLEFEAATSDDLIRTIISGIYMLTFDKEPAV
jgi:hypothetical protein